MVTAGGQARCLSHWTSPDQVSWGAYPTGASPLTVSRPLDLQSIGWDPAFQQAFSDLGLPGCVPARVAAVHPGRADLLGAPSAFLRPGLEVAVGDWVATGERIVAVLPRRTALVRQSAGDRTRKQIVAANVDVVFVVTSMNRDFNPRRVERYLAAVHASGARPVLVLNKADLDLGGHRRYLGQVPDVEALVTSSLLGLGIDALRAEARGTAAFVGSSGVGKSSLINALLGADVQDTGGVRPDDQRGRHTTTRRELLPLPGGGVLVDTPGLRELQLWDGSGLDAVFEDLAALAATCRYRDCRHEVEEGCAVLGAVEAGTVDPARVKSWRKLAREAERRDGRIAEWELRRRYKKQSERYRRIQEQKIRDR